MTHNTNGPEPAEITPVPFSFIVGFWSQVFLLLSTISLFEALRKVFLRRASWAQGHAFVEGYVIFMTVASVVALSYAASRLGVESTWLLVSAALFGAYRVFEITVYQINVLMFDEYRAKTANRPYAVRGYRRIVILLVHNYFEIVCWFGLIYVFLYRDNRLGELTPEPSFIAVFRESMLLMFSFNPYRYEPQDDLAVVAFSTQAVVGIFMTLMVLARFLSLLPPPKTMDTFEK